jgi:predicted lipid-binding transport protein (Tim44 family)
MNKRERFMLMGGTAGGAAGGVAGSLAATMDLSLGKAVAVTVVVGFIVGVVVFGAFRLLVPSETQKRKSDSAEPKAGADAEHCAAQP